MSPESAKEKPAKTDARSLRDFFAAWGENDPDGRADLIRSAVGERFYYADPQAKRAITTADDFLAFLGRFPADASATVIEPADIHHGHARANVRFDFGGGKEMVGQYFAKFDGKGRIARIVGFPGKGAE